MPKQAWLASAGAVVLLALALRLVFVIDTANWIEFAHPVPGMDVDLLWQAAAELDDPDNTIPHFALLQPSAPGFVWLLSVTRPLLETLTTDALFVHRILMSILGTLTVITLMAIAWTWTQRYIVTLVTGMLAATYPALVYFDTQVIKVTPELLLLSVALLLVLRLQNGSVPGALLRGILIGCALLLVISSQFGAVFYVAAITLFIACNTQLQTAQRGLILAGLLAVTTMGGALLQQPQLYSQEKYGAFLPVHGIHMAVGWHEGATGTYHHLDNIPPLPLGHTFVSRMEAERSTGTLLTPKAADAWWVRHTLDYIVQHPADSAVILGKKILLFFSNHETNANEYFYDIERKSQLLQDLPLNWGILLLLAVTGMMVLFRQHDRRAWLMLMLIGAVLLSNIITFVTWRYRVHALLPLLLCAGIGLVELLDCLRRLEFRPLLPSLPLVLVTGVLCFMPLAPDVMAKMEAVSAGNLHHTTLLAKYQEKLDDINALPETDNRQRAIKALMLFGLHRHTENYQYLSVFVRNHRQHQWPNAIWVTYLAWLGEAGTAREFLQQLQQEDPETYARTLTSLPDYVQHWCAVFVLSAPDR